MVSRVESAAMDALEEHFPDGAALLSMLSSCSPGISVMNIDNGLGAAAAALRILRGSRGAVTSTRENGGD